ncbi:MAG TPA: hypothetical protein VGN69_08550 [Solirubrobacteraceae bacterium]|nr:hypothetical protein [Solirubrobacteraceae bacterium]
MRLHISLDDALVAELDRRVGRRRRSAFIAATLHGALDDAGRWERILATLGTVPDTGHDWDPDSAGWVRAQRHADGRRVG